MSREAKFGGQLSLGKVMTGIGLRRRALARRYMGLDKGINPEQRSDKPSQMNGIYRK